MNSPDARINDQINKIILEKLEEDEQSETPSFKRFKNFLLKQEPLNLDNFENEINKIKELYLNNNNEQLNQNISHFSKAEIDNPDSTGNLKSLLTISSKIEELENKIKSFNSCEQKNEKLTDLNKQLVNLKIKRKVIEDNFGSNIKLDTYCKIVKSQLQHDLLILDEVLKNPISGNEEILKLRILQLNNELKLLTQFIQEEAKQT
jgi:hypothetical protein